jgi:hypothetical protein
MTVSPQFFLWSQLTLTWAAASYGVNLILYQRIEKINRILIGNPGLLG